MTKLLNSRIALLESQVDVLETELTQLNNLLVECGFPEGIKTLKSTVEELLANQIHFSEDDLEQQF